MASKISHGREAGHACRATYSTSHGLRAEVCSEGADNGNGRSTPKGTRREREDGIAVVGPVRRHDRSSEAIVRHLSDHSGLGLCQPRIGSHHRERVFSGAPLARPQLTPEIPSRSSLRASAS